MSLGKRRSRGLCAQYYIRYGGWCKASAQLGLWLKRFLIKFKWKDQYSKNSRLMEGRIYWQWTKRQSGPTPKCMAQTMVILLIFWFDVPLKVLWPILTCKVVKCWYINSKLSAMIYNNRENSSSNILFKQTRSLFHGTARSCWYEGLSSSYVSNWVVTEGDKSN